MTTSRTAAGSETIVIVTSGGGRGPRATSRRSPRGDQQSHLRRCPVVHRDVVAFRQEVPAHRLAHDPEPDKTHLRHHAHLPRRSDPLAKFPP